MAESTETNLVAETSLVTETSPVAGTSVGHNTGSAVKVTVQVAAFSPEDCRRNQLLYPGLVARLETEAAQTWVEPEVMEECQDTHDNLCQDLFLCTSTQEYDAIVNTSLKIEDMHLHNAKNMALKSLAERRQKLPAEPTGEPSKIVFPRPNGDTGVWKCISCPIQKQDVAPQEGWKWRLLQTNLQKQKRIGWKERSCVYSEPKTVPAASGQIVVAALGMNIWIYTFDVTMQRVLSMYSVAIPHPCDSLQVSALDTTAVAIQYGRGVIFYKFGDAHAILHVVDHPAFTEEAYMVSACHLRSIDQLYIGTVLGCLFGVIPSGGDIFHFMALQKVLPIRTIISTPDAVALGTVNEVYVVPDKEEFTRRISITRPVDFAIRGRLLVALLKYGSLVFYDLTGVTSPGSIQPPAEVCNAKMRLPWYSALNLSEDGQVLTAMYPDGLCRVYHVD